MKKISILLILIGMILGSNSYAATYYVSSTGNDSNPGTDVSPWASLYKVNQTIVAGDTVYLKRGDTWLVTNAKYTNGEALGDGLYIKNKNNVTIGAYGSGALPIIDATARTDRSATLGAMQNYSCIQIGVNYTSYPTGIIIQDLDLRGAANGMVLSAYNAGNGLTLSRISVRGSGWSAESMVTIFRTATIEDSFFDSLTGNSTGYSKSIEVFTASGVIVRRNVFRGFGEGGALRYSNQATNGLVERNYFHTPGALQANRWAIVMRNADGGTHTVRNNVFDLKGTTATGDALRAMSFWGDYAVTIRKVTNNTIFSDGRGYGVKGSGDVGVNVNIQMINNIFYDVETSCDNCAGVSYYNNIFYSLGSKYSGTPTVEIGSSTANPALYNAASPGSAEDLRLTAASTAAINSGYVDSSNPTDDYSGNARSVIDIGAFEYGSQSQSQISAPTNLRILP